MRMGCIRRLSIWGCSEKSRMGAEQLITEKVKFQHRSLEERARDFGGKLGPYTEYDWGEPKGREIL